MAKKERYSDFSRPVLRMLWSIFALVLAASVLAETQVYPHGHFALANTFAFHAWYGFAACAGIVGVSIALGYLLKRPENYYTEREKR